MNKPLCPNCSEEVSQDWLDRFPDGMSSDTPRLPFINITCHKCSHEYKVTLIAEAGGFVFDIPNTMPLTYSWFDNIRVATLYSLCQKTYSSAPPEYCSLDGK